VSPQNQGDQWSPLRIYFLSATTPSLSSPQGEDLTTLEGSWRQYRLRGGYAIFITTTPSLRDTSPQEEALWLPLRGAVNAVD